MKTKKIIWMFIVILMASTTAYSQGYGYGIRQGQGYGYGPGYGECVFGQGYGAGYGGPAILRNLDLIPDITEDQKAKITEMEINHRKAMAELRVKQLSTDDVSERIEIGGKMAKKGLTHRDEIRNLLSEEQKEKLDLLLQGRFYRGMGYGRGFRGRGGRGAGCRFPAGGYGFRQGW
jgi:hypothetical protein